MVQDGPWMAGALGETQQEVRRLFRELIMQPWGGTHLSGSSDWQPRIDIAETAKAIIVEVELPGMKRSEISVEVEGDVLRIAGERRTVVTRRTRHYYQVERSTGRFARQVQLPQRVDRDAIQARFRAGILTITLPKTTSH